MIVYIGMARGSPGVVPSSESMVSPETNKEAGERYVLIRIRAKGGHSC